MEQFGETGLIEGFGDREVKQVTSSFPVQVILERFHHDLRLRVLPNNRQNSKQISNLLTVIPMRQLTCSGWEFL